jgi:hypothetical protein
MRYLFFLSILITNLGCRQKLEINKEFPVLIETFSPKSNLSLDFKNGKFELAKCEFDLDVVTCREITTGQYTIDGDLMRLKGANGKNYSLRIETEEILVPVDFDTLKQSYKFLAWTIYYDNGQTRQNGGWTKNNAKDGVWTFYDVNGKIINEKLYEKGKLVNDNFKYESR